MHKNDFNKLNELLKEERIIYKKKKYVGTSNETWFVKTNKDKYQFRIVLSDIKNIDRNTELKLMNYFYKNEIIYSDDKYLLRRWIKGTHFRIFNKKTAFAINEEIKKLKESKIILPIKINLFDYSEYIPNKYKEKYINLVNNLDKQKLVVSHSDLTRRNILKNNKLILFIDFEWSRMSYEWFDISYLIINNYKKFHEWMSELTDIKYLLITAIYSYSWCIYTNNKKSNKLKSRYLKWINILWTK